MLLFFFKEEKKINLKGSHTHTHTHIKLLQDVMLFAKFEQDFLFFSWRRLDMI